MSRPYVEAGIPATWARSGENDIVDGGNPA